MSTSKQTQKPCSGASARCFISLIFAVDPKAQERPKEREEKTSGFLARRMHAQPLDQRGSGSSMFHIENRKSANECSRLICHTAGTVWSRLKTTIGEFSKRILQRFSKVAEVAHLKITQMDLFARKILQMDGRINCFPITFTSSCFFVFNFQPVGLFDCKHCKLVFRQNVESMLLSLHCHSLQQQLEHQDQRCFF